jgi:outer membrane protein TolC
MQENAALMQRAYALGEADLQAMLLARRQATAAMNNALQAQVAALRAYYGLLVDAHLIWELEHD